MNRHPSEPLEAVVLPDLPPAGSGAWKNWALAVGAFGLFLVCSGTLFWGLGKLVHQGFSGGGTKGSLIYAWETPEEQAANVAAAMNAQTTGCTAVELRELTRFFDGVLESLGQGEHSSFRKLVDQNAFAHRASLHPVAVASDDFDQGELESQLDYDLEGPRGYSRFSLVHVARGTAANEAIVYVILSGDGQNPTPFRWWLRRSGRNWTICDWEVIDCGQSEADRWARTRSIASDANNASYWQASAAIKRALGENQAGRRGAAAAQLRDAEKKALPTAVHDMTQLDLAIPWLNAGRPDLALVAADRVAQPDSNIGTLHIRVRALNELERPAELLKALDQYRALAGSHPDLLRIGAEALEAQGQRKEAAECCWEILRLMPDDRGALFEFCRLADDQRRADIQHLFAKSKKPIDRAVEAAAEAIQRDEIAAAEALLAYIRAAEPDSAAVEYLTALQLDYDQRYSLAAEHYLSAQRLESHPERKKEHFQRYLASMAAARRATEAYQAAEDKDAAFEYLTAGHEYEESYVTDQDLAELIAAHGQRKPDDARIQYLSAKLLLNQGKYAEAAAEMLQAESGADENLSGLIRSGRLEAIYREGSIKDAYEAYPNDSEEAFRELAWLTQGRQDDRGLGELIGLHVRRVPADPWVSYFIALREERAGNYTAALTILRSVESSDNENLQSLATRLKTELYIKSDNLHQAYQTGGPPAEAFVRIANRLADRGDWDNVLKLSELRPTDGPALYFATKARWQLEKYDVLVQNLTPWPTERFKTLDQAWVAEMADLHVRAWLRIRPGEDARKAAELIESELGLSLPLATAELKLGNRERVKELLANPIVGRELFRRQLPLDAEWAAILDDPEFADLRRRYALERPNDYGRRGASILLLLKQPPAEARWTEAFDRAVGTEVAARARYIAFSAGDTPRSDTVGGLRSSRLVDLPGGTLLVTTGSVPYCDVQSLPASLTPDNPVRQAILEHTAWIAIDLLLADQHGPAEELEQTAQRLAAELCDDNAAAVYVTVPRASSPRLTLADEVLRGKLADGSLLRATVDVRDAIYLYQTPTEVTEADRENWSIRRKALRELADQGRVEKAAGYGAIRVRWQRGHAQEEVWLNVVRSKRGYYKSEEFVAEMTQDSQLWPHLRTGERVRIGYYEPLEVRPLLPAAAEAAN